MRIPDGVNSLVFTIIRHFIGTPSNITSRVILREDSNKPFWKEKFIDDLPNLFAHKIQTVLVTPMGSLTMIP